MSTERRSLVLEDPEALASALANEVRGLDTPTGRRVVRRHARALAGTDAGVVLDVSRALMRRSRWLAYELVASHAAAFRRLDEPTLEALGQGIASWDAVDAFSRTLAGPAWLRGQVSDGLIERWALRALVVHDPEDVRGFLIEHDSALASRVKREVRHKLATGLKHPRWQRG